ncbi:MAG TPA: hypothetical protein ENH63_05035 [Sulfitobacter litoralis]|uniref:Uncharacterized protein n=1 Tax=Sulfitobacter litoralis TaxID=335975 RepID=A0A7V1BE27_9RHOB|nr:hypothetical protein [Sulfitobacter litoralis]HDY94510.1 hypothetical protein [Sulfitobacter litoralis]HDZ51148.1 hypothetical protein [Sulfitobacter litoralis]|tara:strand:+ start:490 stop:1053 length:564 start_codon:yes stop_codon:yes gene_type:complete
MEKRAEEKHMRWSKYLLLLRTASSITRLEKRRETERLKPPRTAVKKDRKMEKFPPTSSFFSKDPSLNIVRLFFSEFGEATQNAILLLGGPSAHRRCLRLFTALREANSLTRRHKEELVRLHSVLMLDAFDGSEDGPFNLFVAIHPSDPIVEDLCLLADGLLDLLQKIDSLPTDCEGQASLAAKDHAA